MCVFIVILIRILLDTADHNVTPILILRARVHGLSVVCDDAGHGALDPVDPTDLGDEVLEGVAALGLDLDVSVVWAVEEVGLEDEGEGVDLVHDGAFLEGVECHED